MAFHSSGPPGVDLATIPNLPGYNHQRKKKQFHKGQTFGLVNGMRVEHKEGITFERPKLVLAPKQADNFRLGSTLPMSEAREAQQAVQDSRTSQELPAWDALDRHVLRFWGQFKETVHETNLEHFRVRHVVVLYYLEDDTCHVIEPKQDNAGIPQGTMVRRHRFPGPNGGYLTPVDMVVGQHLPIYGRVIRLTDCDEYTRQFFEAQGVQQPEPERRHDDQFQKTSVGQRAQAGAPPRTSERLYREVALGGGHVNKEMQQFLEWDRRVCRFFAVQDDLSTPQFERRPFIIFYFLADNTVEIREQYPLNAGRDAYPRFFRRGPMPRGAVEVRGPLDEQRRKEDFVQVHELAVGEVVELSGYTFFIYDADGFTREYFQRELGMELAADADVRLPERAVPRAKTPPYTGYGSWDDSMGSVTALCPKPPRKDFNKLFHQAGKLLRFTARFVNPKPEDLERVFIVLFDLADDSMSIHEPPQRNLGIITGKFLEKGIHMNQNTGQLFNQGDLEPGNIISVHNRQFVIIEMDEYTRKYRDGQSGRPYELATVLEKIREGMRQQYPLVRDIFRKFDADRDGVISFSEFKQALQRWGFLLSDSDVLILMRHFDTREDGQISYNEFCDVLLDQDYTQDMMQVKDKLNEAPDDAYAERAMIKEQERIESDKVRKAMREIGDVMYKHSYTFTKIFKEFAHLTHERNVTVQQVQAAMMQIGHAYDLDTVRRCVLFVMPDVDLNHIDYVHFLKAMSSTFHDVCRVR